MAEALSLPTDFSFNQSNLESYLACKRQFQLRYVRKLVWPAQTTSDTKRFEADRQAGIRFHLLIHQYFLGVKLERLLEVAQNDPDERVNSWFDYFLAQFHEGLTGHCLPEFTLVASVAGHALTAKYDLLRWTGEEVVIYDWKTSFLPVPLDREKIKVRLNARMQSKVLPLVAWLTRWPDGEQNLERKITLSYWEARDPGNPIFLPYDAQSAVLDGQVIQNLIREITTTPLEQFFQTNDERKCLHCTYRSYCQRGIRAGDYNEVDTEGMPFTEDLWTQAESELLSEEL